MKSAQKGEGSRTQFQTAQTFNLNKYKENIMNATNKTSKFDGWTYIQLNDRVLDLDREIARRVNSVNFLTQRLEADKAEREDILQILSAPTSTPQTKAAFRPWASEEVPIGA